MKHLDFTIDFETCALSANAAPMQVVIVPWRREAESDPFILDDTGEATEEAASAWPEPLELYVDLRTCVTDGYDFDPETIAWWTRQTYEAKRAVCDGLPQPIDEVTVEIVNYLRRAVEQLHLDSICLWSQGDTDMGILRNLCRRHDFDMEEDVIPHTQLRDCRTIILEAAFIKRAQEIAKSNEEFLRSGKAVSEVEILDSGAVVPCPAVSPQEVLANPRKAYDLFPTLPSCYAEGRCLHDALYDALRSTWYTWQALKTLQQ